MQESCLLLFAALFAVPGVLSQDNTTTFTIKQVDVAIQELMQQMDCKTYNVLYEAFLHLFLEVDKNQYNIQTQLDISITTIQYKAVNSSSVIGLVVNIFVSPNGNVCVNMEYKSVFVQVTITGKTIIITFSIMTVDGCTCSTVSYDSTYVYLTDDYYDDSTTVCSVCGGNTTTTPCPGCGCDATTTTVAPGSGCPA